MGKASLFGGGALSTQVRGDVDPSRPDSARGVVVIVGGSTGIGLACADELARLGRKIVVSRHHHSPPVDRPFLSFPLDLEEIESIDDFCDKVGELPEPILAVIVTAGVRRDRSALRLTRSEFDSTIRVNALGGARVIRSLLPRLLENPRSQVCVVGSVVASIGTAHQLAYVASKAWWVGFVRSLAMEFGERGMTANLVEKYGKIFLVLGTPGGATIPTSIFQVILDVVVHGMTLQEAVDFKRFHHQWLPDEIMVEDSAFSTATWEVLRAMGHRVCAREPIGRVDAILRNPEGKLEGAADKRRDDVARGF